MMKVLHFMGIGRVPERPSVDAVAGTERVVLEIARIQAKRGVDVTVASMGPKAWQGTWEGMTLRHLGPCSLPAFIYRGAAKKICAHLNLIRCVRFGRFDIIHLHEYRKTHFFGAVPTIMHFHNNPLDGMPDEALARVAPAYWQEIGKADAQIAVSAFVQRRLQLTHTSAGEDAPLANIVVNQSGVDVGTLSSSQKNELRRRKREKLGLKDSDVLFMFAGAVRQEKGVVQLAQAFSILAAEQPNARLVVAGGSKLWVAGQASTEAAEQQVHRILASEVKLKRAALVGIVSPALLPAYYAAADVLVLPSLFQETFGLVILEAFAAGIPVIGARSGGVPELVQNERTGLLVEQGDVAGLTDAMRRLLVDDDLRARLGAAASKVAAKMPWENTVDRLELIYRGVLSLL